MPALLAPLRLFAAIALLGFLAACAAAPGLDDPNGMRPMGDFRLGHVVVKIDEPQVGPVSRRAPNQLWEDTMLAALRERFGGYEGENFYHLGVSIDGYSLNPPGPPMITPKSMLIVTVTVIEDRTGRVLNEPELVTVFEEFGPEFMLGTGFTRTRDEQIRVLTRNSAFAIQTWMLKNPEWFGLPPRDDDASGA
jgi:hypothetical protein